MFGDTVKTIASGVVAIGLVAAIGIHSGGLTKFSTGTIKSTGGLFGTVEKG
jgi:hypothetical protein